jgi:hypothetical protein
MRHPADIVVFSKGAHPVLAVEIEAGKETSPRAAARFRRSHDDRYIGKESIEIAVHSWL